MSVNSRRKARLKQKQAIWNQILESLANDDPYQYDPKFQRLAEICKEKHLQLSEAWAIVEKEFPEE